MERAASKGDWGNDTCFFVPVVSKIGFFSRCQMKSELDSLLRVFVLTALLGKAQGEKHPAKCWLFAKDDSTVTALICILKLFAVGNPSFGNVYST